MADKADWRSSPERRAGSGWSLRSSPPRKAATSSSPPIRRWSTPRASFERYGVEVRNVETDPVHPRTGSTGCSTPPAGARSTLLVANAGHGLGRAFLEQEPAEWRHVIDTNITGTVYLVQRVARSMVARGEGRILITGSIAGAHGGRLPGRLQRLQGLRRQLRRRAAPIELKDSEVTDHLPEARRHRHPFLRARRPQGHRRSGR